LLVILDRTKREVATPSAAELAAKLSAQLGRGALAEARYRLSLAEARFQVSLARTGKDLAAIDQWVAVSRLLMDAEPAEAATQPPATTT
jgi:hypothetical protein